ncbi:16S rRNA (guanine(527)-N(7))-methyltransferase RsmG [Candidatus Peregrinibacteria bacterium]|nr:MAG: 16S rRNA (guanine(527)-N(7))-methyltransferase RsmG [Candidatus Peregrinibacteria bacterium]
MNLPLLQSLLEQKSQELNLFSAGDRLKIGEKHLPDSLAVLEFWMVKKGAQGMDVGTGGGLPGLALAVSCPEVKFTLVDAREKKMKAVQQMIEALKLKNASTLVGRLEELGHEKKYRERFDFVTARALAALPVLLEYSSSFLKVGGHLYAWKGPEYLEELTTSQRAQAELGLLYRDSFIYSLAGSEERVILRFEKVKSLSASYPRRVGVPSAKPL